MGCRPNSLCKLSVSAQSSPSQSSSTVLYAPKVSCTNGEPLTSLACVIRIHHAQNVEEIREKIKSIHNPSYSGLRETTCLLKFRQLGKEVIRDWPVKNVKVFLDPSLTCALGCDPSVGPTEEQLVRETCPISLPPYLKWDS